MCVEFLLYLNKVFIEVLENKVLFLDEVLEIINYLLFGSILYLKVDRELYICVFNRLLIYCYSIVLLDVNMLDEVVDYI